MADRRPAPPPGPVRPASPPARPLEIKLRTLSPLRMRLREIVRFLAAADAELHELHQAIEPKSDGAGTLLREARESVAKARRSLENYQDELEAWD